MLLPDQLPHRNPSGISPSPDFIGEGASGQVYTLIKKKMTLQRRTPYRVELRQPNAEEIMIRDYYSFDPNPSGISPSPDFIGEGASGQVFKGKCVKTGLSVAIKRISKRIKRSSSIAQVVGQEWAANQAITDNTHIVQLIQLVETKQYVYFVQELMGSELFDAVTKATGGLTERQAKQATKSLLLGLKHLHVDLGKVHRDIKPENLLLPFGEDSNFNGLKVADLGFCTTPENATSFMGTEAYCPGEVLLKQETTMASDMWSVGVCLYIMLCGYPPFYSNLPHPSDRRVDLKNKIIQCEYTMDGIEWERRSNESKQLVVQLMQKKPSDRLAVEQACEHAWFNDPSASSSTTTNNTVSDDLSQIATNMRRFNVRRKFQRAVRVLVSTIRWRKYLERIREQRADLNLSSQELLRIINSTSSLERSAEATKDQLDKEEKQRKKKRKTSSSSSSSATTTTSAPGATLPLSKKNKKK